MSSSKSTVDEIRERFDNEVDRFSNLQTGQSATMDAPLVLDLIANAVARTNPDAGRVLDVGCGGGNYSLKLLGRLPRLHFDLLDLSERMLARAADRLRDAGARGVAVRQGDIREVSLDPSRYDIVVAAAVLHHLRTDAEWEQVFARLYRTLRPGGSLWVTDLIDHSVPAIAGLMWERYGEYLTELGDEEYRDRVFGYIEREDTPKPLLFQVDLLRAVGFRSVEVLHKNAMFAAYVAIK